MCACGVINVIINVAQIKLKNGNDFMFKRTS